MSQSRALFRAVGPLTVIFWVLPAAAFLREGLNRPRLVYLSIVALGIVALMHLLRFALTSSRRGANGLTPSETFGVYDAVGRGEEVANPMYAGLAVQVATSRLRLYRIGRVVGPVLLVLSAVGLSSESPRSSVSTFLMAVYVTLVCWIQQPRTLRAIELNQRLVGPKASSGPP